METPTWEALEKGVRPAGVEEEREPSEGHWWQKHAALTMHSHHQVQVVWPHLTQVDRDMVRSQSGPLSSVSQQ